MTNRWIRLSLALAIASPLATSAMVADSAALEKTESKIIAIDQDTRLVALADETRIFQRGTPSGDKLTSADTTVKQENARYRAVRS
ncbi:MAG: hypothetical protein RIC24_06735 [Hyphomicrobiales bacterium]|jgi:hypothetical protein